MNEEQPHFTAVRHLHSLHAAAVSVLADVDSDDVMPPLTEAKVAELRQRYPT